jgi:nucleolar pre-ribosomal-associated protein 1
VHLTKGLQSTSPLVRHCTALALAKCLDKLGRVVRAFRDVATGLEEDEHDGQWSARCRDVEREVGRRAPDFQVIIAFAHQKATNLAPSTVAPSTLPSASQDTLLDEVAHRLLSLYHAYLPSLVAEARYDAGKSLQKFAHSTILRNEENSGKLNMSGLHTLRRLHVLAILRETDQFSLGSKAGMSLLLYRDMCAADCILGSSTNTNLHILLSEYISTNGTAVRSGIAALIQKHLATTLLFQHDPDEIHSWLSAIPITRRAPDAHTADGTPLSDERETIVSFLDECIQRCTKTPYRYLEEFDALLASTVGQPEADSVHEVLTSHSPLLMTVLEQLSAKTVGMLLTPSELLAIASFSRKLLFLLATTRSDLRILRECAKRLATVLRRASDLLKEHPMVATAIVHEVNILLVMLDSLQGIQPSVTREIAQSSAADAFLDAAYNSPICTSH